jgi:signal transduction histidine kinase
VPEILTDDIERESFRRFHEEVLSKRATGALHFEAVLLVKPGGNINVLASMALLPGSRTSIVSLIDISREKSYEEQLEERAGRLREFLTIASHELRQPITIIQGYTATLNQFVSQLSPESVREIYQAMNSSAERLTRIVEELMDVNRIEKEEVALDRRACDFSPVLAGAVEAMRSRGAHSEFSTAVNGLDRQIFIDPERISQCLMALLENAVNFSPDRSPVDITADLWHDMLEVRVMDRGPGVPEGSREKVFERFFQVEEALHHSKPGIGLGLYIAHEIVCAHGGTITCEDRGGGGSVFRFNIPC